MFDGLSHSTVNAAGAADTLGLDASWASFMSDVNNWVVNNWIGIGTDLGDYVDSQTLNPLTAAWTSADSCGFICNGIDGTQAGPDG